MKSTRRRERVFGLTTNILYHVISESRSCEIIIVTRFQTVCYREKNPESKWILIITLYNKVETKVGFLLKNLKI